MKVVIAGSREITDYELVKQAVIESGFEITQVVSGGARGVDSLAERYAKENNIPCRVITADWDRIGKSAGFLRNKEMCEESEALIAIWDGKSKGTGHTIKLAYMMKLKVYIKKINPS